MVCVLGDGRFYEMDFVCADRQKRSAQCRKSHREAQYRYGVYGGQLQVVWSLNFAESELNDSLIMRPPLLVRVIIVDERSSQSS